MAECYSSRLNPVFRMWCARQESNLLPCGPEFQESPFGLSVLNSLSAIACRRFAGLISPTDVRGPAWRYHVAPKAPDPIHDRARRERHLR